MQILKENLDNDLPTLQNLLNNEIREREELE